MKINWITVLCFFIVIVATARIAIQLQTLSYERWWIMVVFSFFVWVACVYEITIKQAIITKIGNMEIIFKVILFWVSPLIFGWFIGWYLMS